MSDVTLENYELNMNDLMDEIEKSLDYQEVAKLSQEKYTR